MNFSGNEDHPNVQHSTRPGIEPETSGLEGRHLTTACANPSAQPGHSNNSEILLALKSYRSRFRSKSAQNGSLTSNQCLSEIAATVVIPTPVIF